MNLQKNCFKRETLEMTHSMNRTLNIELLNTFSIMCVSSIQLIDVELKWDNNVNYATIVGDLQFCIFSKHVSFIERIVQF